MSLNPLTWWENNLSLHLRNADPGDTIYLMQVDLKSYDIAWEADEWREVALNPYKNTICVTRNSMPIAFAVYEILNGQLRLLRLGVMPKFRRQKIGTSILKWIHKLMTDRALRRGSCIVPINNVPAANFLKSGGWSVPPKGGIVKDAFEDCGEPIEGLYFLKTF